MKARARAAEQTKVWNPFFVFCLVLQGVYMLSFNMVTPLIARYVVDLGGSLSIAGVVAGMFSFCALLFRPLIGYIADRTCRKKLLAIGIIICAISMAGYALSSSVAVVAVLRVLHAAGLCIQTTLIAVMAVDFIPPERVAECVGYVGIAAMVGMSLGPGIGVLIADALDIRLAFLAGAALMLVTLALVVPLPKIPAARGWGSTGTSGIRDFLDITALPLSAFGMAFAFCSGMTSGFLVLLGDDRGIDGITLFFLISSLGMVLVRPFSGRYADRHGLDRISILALSAEIADMVTLAFANALPAVICAAVCRTFGQGIAQTAIQGQIIKDAPPENRGVASSTFYLGIDIGQGAGAMLGGAIADTAGYMTAFFTGPAVLLFGSVCFLFWRRRRA